tara:strand:+ start:39783 stop:40910 length:1128 start_codon:yes stop_codon:yes gene_type:complete
MPLDATTRLTREELYGMVWQTPMSRLASSFGLSGNGLKKICARHDIPVPPRGYWARKAAGQRVVKYRLQTSTTPAQQIIEIRPTPPAKPKPADIPPMKVTIPRQTRQQHRLVADWVIEDKERRRKGWRYDIGVWARYHPDPFSQTGQRRYRVLDALFKALEKEKLSIQLGDRQSILIADGNERIEISIREKKKQDRRPMTAAELRWRSPGEKNWRVEMVGSGILVFEVKSYLPEALKRSWTETAEQSLEDCLGEILGTICAAIPLLRIQRQREAEMRRLREIEESKAQELRRQKRQDENRWRRFIEIARNWEDVEKARRLFDHLAPAAELVPGDQRIADGVAWIDRRLTQGEAKLADIEEILAELETITEWTYRD